MYSGTDQEAPASVFRFLHVELVEIFLLLEDQEVQALS